MLESIDHNQLQYLNSIYIYPKHGKDEKGKYLLLSPDYLLMIFRDEVTKRKHCEVICEPQITFYIVKDEYQDEIRHHLNWLELYKVEPRTVSYRELYRELSKIMGREDLFFNIVKTDKKELRDFHMNHNIFGSDIHIEDFYKNEFLKKYQSKTRQVTKSYLDIEVDNYKYGKFPEEDIAPCPINAVSLLLEETKIVHTFLLEGENSLINEFRENLGDFIKEQESEYEGLKFEVNFYKTEIELIKGVLSTIHLYSPDFCLCWNMRFDILTIINRIKILGENPEELFCDIDPEFRRLYFKKDEFHKEIEDKTDYFVCSSFTQYLDQMIMFASIRKGGQKKESYSLQYTAETQLKDSKLDYSEVSELSSLPYIDYRRFVKYNNKDVILLHYLEEKNKDLDLLIQLGEKSSTRLTHVMRKTVSLKNLGYKFYIDQGFIMGNNPNSGNKRDGTEEKFEGAVVCLPSHNDHFGMELFGKRSKSIFNWVIDFDMSSLYPSVIMGFNLDSSTQYGRITIEGDKKRGNKFMDDLLSQDYVNLGKEYFQLPGTEEMIKGFERYLVRKNLPFSDKTIENLVL